MVGALPPGFVLETQGAPPPPPDGFEIIQPDPAPSEDLSTEMLDYGGGLPRAAPAAPAPVPQSVPTQQPGPLPPGFQVIEPGAAVRAPDPRATIQQQIGGDFRTVATAPRQRRGVDAQMLAPPAAQPAQPAPPAQPEMAAAPTLSDQWQSGVETLQQGAVSPRVASAVRVLRFFDRVDQGYVPASHNEDPLGYYDRSPEQRARIRQEAETHFGTGVRLLLESRARQSALPRVAEVEALGRALNERDFSSAWRVFSSNPLGIMQQLTVESLPSTAIPAAAGLALSPIGRGAAVAGALGGSYGAEYGPRLTEILFRTLQEQGVDVTSQEAVSQAITRDPAIVQRAAETAGLGAYGPALFDALTMGLARGIRPGAGTLRNTGRVSGNVALEAGAEAAGEATGQALQGEDFQLGDIVLEALGGVGQGVPTTAASTIIEAREARRRGAQPATAPTAESVLDQGLPEGAQPAEALIGAVEPEAAAPPTAARAEAAPPEPTAEPPAAAPEPPATAAGDSPAAEPQPAPQAMTPPEPPSVTDEPVAPPSEPAVALEPPASEAALAPAAPESEAIAAPAPVSAAPARPQARPPSLLEALSRRGIRDDGGDLRSMGADAWHRGRPGRPRLLRPDGVSLDEARLVAEELGYIGRRDAGDSQYTTTQDLRDAIDRELRGTPVYPVDYVPDQPTSGARAENRRAMEAAADEEGVEYSARTPDATLQQRLTAAITRRQVDAEAERAAEEEAIRLESEIVSDVDNRPAQEQPSADDLPFDFEPIGPAPEGLQREEPGAPGQGDRVGVEPAAEPDAVGRAAAEPVVDREPGPEAEALPPGDRDRGERRGAEAPAAAPAADAVGAEADRLGERRGDAGDQAAAASEGGRVRRTAAEPPFERPSTGRINDTLRARSSPEWRSNRAQQRAARALLRTLRRKAPRAAVVFAEHLEGRTPSEDWFRVTGGYDPQADLIAVALAREAGDTTPGFTGNHETIHHLRRSGLISDAEWSTLERAAREQGWITDDIRARYPGASESLLTEEAVADAYARWSEGQRQGISAAVLRIFRKIQEFFRGLTADLNSAGIRGHEDVFRAIEGGEVGGRRMEPTLEPAGETVFQRKAREQIPTGLDLFNNWEMRREDVMGGPMYSRSLQMGFAVAHTTNLNVRLSPVSKKWHAWVAHRGDYRIWDGDFATREEAMQAAETDGVEALEGKYPTMERRAGAGPLSRFQRPKPSVGEDGLARVPLTKAEAELLHEFDAIGDEGNSLRIEADRLVFRPDDQRALNTLFGELDAVSTQRGVGRLPNSFYDRSIEDRILSVASVESVTASRFQRPKPAAEPAPEHERALEESNAASRAFMAATADYRARKIGDDEYLTARRAHDAAQKAFDAAYDAEQKRARARPAKAAPSQIAIPGTEPIPDREVAERRMAERGTEKQRGKDSKAVGDLPLFDTNAPKQGTLFETPVPESPRDPNTPAQQIRVTAFKRAMKGGPLDAIARLPFDLVGMTDKEGHLKFGKWLIEKTRYLKNEATAGTKVPFSSWINPALARARAGLIDRYGLDPDYVARDKQIGVEKGRLMKPGIEFSKFLMNENITTQEAAVINKILTGDPVNEAEWSKLFGRFGEKAEAVRHSIDELGATAVSLGLISRESYERNRSAYLHRVYRKHELEEGPAGTQGRAARVKLISDEMKGRGIFLKVEAGAISEQVAKGAKVRVLDRLRDTDQGSVDVGGRSSTRVVDRAFVPADQPIPERYAGWVDRGAWEVRGADPDGKAVTVWRDYSAQEREQMGEILDSRYTVAKTFYLLAHDIATGRFYKDIAENEEWSRATVGEDEAMSADEYTRAKPEGQRPWVKVPDTAIEGTGGKKKWGALAGRYVRTEIWRDISEVEQQRTSTFWNTLLTQWKLNKLLALDTPLPTPNGWTTMGDVREGDMLFDDRGVPCRVTDVQEIKRDRPAFRVKFSDGTSIVADDEHWWVTLDRSRDRSGVKRRVTTGEIRETLREPTRGDANHSIAVAGPLALPNSALPILPYVLGLWLGDGDRSGGRITAGRALATETRAVLTSVGASCSRGSVRKRDGTQNFSVEGLTAALRRAGYLGRKHIPPIYLRASIKQRRELLCGLMDSDGWITARGDCGFGNSDQGLIGDVMELLRSLGYKPTVRTLVPICTTTKKNGLQTWRINFRAYADEPIFRLEAKRSRLKPRPARSQRSSSRQIVAVEPVPSVPMRCIAVDSPSHLYLAGEGMIPTHNTARSPVVHMNNIISNVMLMDMHDVGARHLVRSLRSFRRGDATYQEAMDAGAFGSSFAEMEARRDILRPILKQIESQTMPGGSTLAARFGLVGKLANAMFTRARNFDDRMLRLYGAEDDIFRLAAYIRRREMGDPAEAAATFARESFIDYDIRAPWINKARRTVLPFLAYTYRAIPMMAKTLALKPWKIAKYAAILHLANALAYSLTGGDEEAERESLDANRRGWLWALFVPLGPRMLRLWNDEHGRPIFLDLRNWVPGGSFLDFQQGQNALPILPSWAQPGGFLGMGAEYLLNREAFTGRDIVNRRTQDASEQASSVGNWLWRAWMPNAAWVPGSWTDQRLSRAAHGERDQGGRPYSYPQAVMASLGIKIMPQDVRQGYEWQLRDIGRTERELAAERRSIQRDLSQRSIDRETFDRLIAANRAKTQRQATERARLGSLIRRLPPSQRPAPED